MPRKRERKEKEAPKPEKLPAGLRQDIRGLLFVALALFIFVANLSSETGLIGFYVIKKALKSFTGIGTYLLPFFFGVLGLFSMLRKSPREFSIQFWGSTLLFLDILLIAQVVSPTYSAKHAGPITGGGGLIGFLFRGSIENISGRVGLYLIIATLTLIAGLLLANTSLGSVGRKWLWILRRKPVPSDAPQANLRAAEQLAAHDQKEARKETQEAPKLVAEPPKRSFHSLKPEKAAPAEENVSMLPLFSQKLRGKLSEHQDGYQLPPLSLLRQLSEREKQKEQKLKESTEFRKRLLEEAMKSFGVNASVIGVSTGPAVTRFEVQPDPGVKVSKIVNLADDIALNLAAHGVRIEAPIPGRSCIGIEVPNATVSNVHFGDLARLNEFQQNPSKLLVALGKDVAGTPIFGDLAKMPHLLIAGTTGSGKSVCLNTLIASLLMRTRPDEVKFILIDPKMVELVNYSDIPHLLAPVVIDTKKAALTLKEWVLPEMERRYRDFNSIGVRNIESYNGKIAHYERTGKSWAEFGFAPEYKPKQRPYIIVIIDELADLMMVAANEVETVICRLAQMARATGIHLVIATQRPSVDVITGLIKANIPSRISFAVATQVDSRTILDSIGAEKLVGRGDMLYSPIGAMKSIRVQGSFISDDEINHIVTFIKAQGKPDYEDDILTLKPKEEQEGEGGNGTSAGQDTLFQEAVKIITESGQASTSYLQRRLRIGYNRAARLMDEIEVAGYVSSPEGERQTRRILKSL